MQSFHNQKTYLKAKKLRELNLYPFFRSINGSEATSVKLNGKEMVMIGSNNYLGLTHPMSSKKQLRLLKNMEQVVLVHVF